MRKIFTLLALTWSFFLAAQNDISVIAITQPVSGCALTSTQTVTIRIFNYGATLPAATSFNVSYTINAGAPVVELVTLGSTLLTNSTLNYTFTTTANLSVPGSYTFDATCSLAGDINASNNAFTGYIVTNTAASVGGTISGGTNVCVTGNSGLLTLSGHTGSVVRWEYSTDGGSTWINISNATTTQAYNNLTVPTQYRAVVQNGSCTQATSSVASMTIDPATVGGTLNGSATRCSGSNAGSLTLTGRTGSIIRWEFSTDGGSTWTNIANTTTSQSYTNLTLTTLYRVLVQSGACTSAYSSTATITIVPPTVGGTISPAAISICSGSNSGTLTLSGHTGTVTRWEFSTDGGSTWGNIANTTTTLNYNNIPQSRLYRVLVQSSPCSSQYSALCTITASPTSVGGTVATSATVCDNGNSGTLNLSGQTGAVNNWQFSTDGGSTWNNIANTTTSQNYLNLVTTTLYRAVVQSPGCTAANSGAATITVNPGTVGGSLSGGTTVCSNSNSGTITLAGQSGGVTSWQFSTDNGLTWNSISNTSTSQNYNNLTDTTIYRALVTSGVCPADTSTYDTVFVDPPTAGGIVGPALDTVCSGANSGTLTLAGNVGNVIHWEYSTDNGLTWITITNTATTQSYNNITTATIYRALVQSGVCSQAYSSTATVLVDPVSVGGTLYGTSTVCGSSNNGTLTLIGFSGNIIQWESSSDNGTTWSTITNTTNSETYTNLIDTTIYRVITQSGVCAADTSTLATIFVDQPSVGGIVTVDDTVCYGANNGTLTLSGHTGIVHSWEYSIDGGNTWIVISNTTTTLNYLNLTQTTQFRASVQNGVCSPVTSTPATITVDPAANGGTITGTTTVCASANSGTLSLNGYSGSVTTWEVSTDAGATWTPDGNTLPTESYTNLLDTTWYRAIIGSGVCGNDTSAVGVIYVDPPTIAGTIPLSDSVCAGMNGDTIHLAGYTGGIVRWEMSNDGFNWIALGNSTDSLIYMNLGATTMYRVEVQSGVCPAQYSNADTIYVDQPSGGGTITGAFPGCPFNNSGTLVLGSSLGVISWESSTDNVTWTTIANTTNSQTWNNLADTTYYHAIVQNGVCPQDTSTTAVIIIYPQPVASFTSDTVCLGSLTHFTNTSVVSAGGISMSNWDLGDNSNTISINPTHTYAVADTFTVNLVATSNFGCSDTASGSVIVHPLPSATITATPSLTICSGDSINLSVPVAANVSYLWNTTATLDNINVDSAATYVVDVTDVLTGCSNSDSVDVTILPRPTANAGLDTSVSAGFSVPLHGSGGIMYSWLPFIGLDDPNAASPVSTPLSTTTYTLTVTDFNGCTDQDTVVVTMVKDFNIIISNLVTANGDGHNDTWYIKNIEFYPENEVHVYNRNGMEVYTADSYHNDWDATYNGTRLPDGTYYYVLKFPDGDKTFSGAVTVVSEK